MMIRVVLLTSILHVAVAMEELTHAMFQARNLGEFLDATPTKVSWEESRNLRSRLLQGLEDSEPVLADMFGGIPGFYHSVASGDPLPSAVVVWTRYTPMTKDESVELEFRMAKVDPALAVDDHLDPTMNPSLHRAKVTVTSESDFIAKIDVTDLESGTAYVFAFSDGSATSPIGRTKTAPGPNETVESMVYAAFSCSHYANGYFHAYDIASSIKDLDFWLHLGDYVYEYGLFSTYASDSPERKSEILPIWEQISLQDHRNRMATYHLDEGLQKLRARAPLIACWDDHESTNNPWGQGTPESTGAENHQEVCPANVTSPDEDKSAAGCDRDEGDVVVRFNNAAQSYLEWLPIRRYEGKMGVVDVGAINQVISWGDMATIVTMDTRMTNRSKDPTLNSNTWGNFVAFASANPNVTAYKTDLMDEINAIATDVHALLESENFTMIGDEGIDFLKTNFEASKQAGQPWQIWATATAMGRAVKGDYSAISSMVTDPAVAAVVEGTTSAIYANEASAFLRALTAQSITSTPWNRDDYSGFAFEQRKILDTMQMSTNNPIVLAGDLHDGYAWQLYEGGAVDGTPCAVNLVCPGVTSPGWGGFVYPAFSVLEDALGGADPVYNLLEKADEAANPGLKYFNHQYKGFFAVKATKESHVAEYFVVDPETILTNYEDARAASGGIVADFKCDAQLTTIAGDKGSLVRSDECSAIEFETEASPITTIPFPDPDPAAATTSLTDCDYTECQFSAKSIDTAEPEGCSTCMGDIPKRIAVLVRFDTEDKIPAAFTPGNGLNMAGEFGFAGEIWPSKTDVRQVRDPTFVIGYVSEMCVRIDSAEGYRCTGTMRFDRYNGYLNYDGTYPDDATGGIYPIVGGTEDFAGASGVVRSIFNDETGTSLRVIDFY